jgi:predicted TIM-barrel fold metal-dependent hydrolase
MSVRVDTHQHLWTDGLLAALAQRAEPPLVRRGAETGGWVLELAGEAPYPFTVAGDEVAARSDALAADGVDLALVALSGALGAETLPPGEARAVIEAWDRDADALPASLAAWASAALREPDPADVDLALDRGRVGLCLPATALADPPGLAHVAPLLGRLAERGAPLFVHPGPAPAGAWLPALTSYAASLSAAWHAWALHGRREHPALRVVFAALAGLAPLQAERLAARGHPQEARAALSDELTFYDTSSYGPLAVGAVAAVVGRGAIVHGSDRPYAEPAGLAPEFTAAAATENAAALLHGSRVTVST